MNDALHALASIPWYTAVAWGCCVCPGIACSIAVVIGALVSDGSSRDRSDPEPDDTDIQPAPPRGPYAPD